MSTKPTIFTSGLRTAPRRASITRYAAGCGKKKGERHQHPTGVGLESQSVTSCTAAPGVRGFDAGKQVNGRQRHLLVDTLGLLLVAVVAAASVQDRDGARWLLGSGKKLRNIGVDGGYAG